MKSGWRCLSVGCLGVAVFVRVNPDEGISGRLEELVRLAGIEAVLTRLAGGGGELGLGGLAAEHRTAGAGGRAGSGGGIDSPFAGLKGLKGRPANSRDSKDSKDSLESGEASLALIADLSQVAAVAVEAVGDLLQAAVGQLHGVGPFGVFQVAGLLVGEVVAGVVVPHGPLEVIIGPGGGGGGGQGQEDGQLWAKHGQRLHSWSKQVVPAHVTVYDYGTLCWFRDGRIVKAKVDEELANISSNFEGKESRSSSNKTAKDVAAVIMPSLANIISVAVSTAVTTAIKDFTDKMENKANEMQRYCLLNKYEYDKLEQYSRRDNLRISGLEENETSLSLRSAGSQDRTTAC
ncbi:hypothetical protein GWK47_030024 [Chionoecetes opilio]|uniref:Uncharacterized protein n=1 Tax=Chionoecetes opilio TaxID=41210 RepID=A0A8J4YW14_CHIOP|nr:hypothetical protein GWK47_030024 [Chionoecetes opilio]